MYISIDISEKEEVNCQGKFNTIKPVFQEIFRTFSEPLF